jgi:amino-acid N-acetyltransferase
MRVCSLTFGGQTDEKGAAAMDYLVRPARTGDVRSIRRLVDANVATGRLLDKATVTLYEDIQEFLVAQRGSDGRVVGSGALHVMWEDLAEIVEALLARARGLGVRRVFVLTFAVKFFGRLGFAEIDGEAAAPEVYAELLRSYDEGVAEFLDLDRVKPNTLGNTRMLLRL